MIGVVSKNDEVEAVREFFQLFKTPWEFYLPEHTYDFVIVTSEQIPEDLDASLMLVYSSRSTELDGRLGITVRATEQTDWLEWDAFAFPIYRCAAVLQGAGRSFIGRRGSLDSVGLEVDRTAPQTLRIGYNLFEEVAFLLSKGQPSGNAHVPTLDIHISLLKSLMAGSGKPFVEIPPVPVGYDFMACLSHDVDFIGIREHKFDMTTWGFLYRATVGSLFDLLRGKKSSWSKLLQNWRAAFSLPLVHLGLVDDFWLEFDRYLEIERGLHATYFFIPFKNCPGALRTGPAPQNRAAKYDVLDSKEDIRKLVEQGCEVSLHGIDAWRDLQKGEIESNQIRKLAGQSSVGIRMHWLYFDEQSPKTLDRAGFAYDSTFGYNDALGFRAGTTQAFSPAGVEHLLELSLNIQDTAMFYPSRMNLSESRALDSCKRLLEITKAFGGCLTVNWHTRSLSPERLWGDFYRALLEEMLHHRVWFGTAQEIVAWFRNRRAVSFEELRFTDEGLHLRLTGPSPDDQHPIVVRVYPGGTKPPYDLADSTGQLSYSDIVWKGEAALNSPGA